MYRMMMKAKIQQTTVTCTQMNIGGGIIIDQTILEAVDLMPYEKVRIVNNNGNYLETHIVAGERDTGIVCVNKANEEFVQKGEHITIISFVLVHEKDIITHKPKIAIMDEDNKIGQIINHDRPLTMM